jgi:hypothetical protein
MEGVDSVPTHSGNQGKKSKPLNDLGTSNQRTQLDQLVIMTS